MICERSITGAELPKAPRILPFAMATESARVESLAIVGGLFLLGALATVSLFEQQRTIIFLAFVFMLVVAPLLAASLVYGYEQGKLVRATTWQVTLVAAKWLFLGFVLVQLLSAFAKTQLWPQSTWLWAAIAYLLVCAVGIIALFARQGRPWKEHFERPDTYLVVALAALAFIYGPFDPGAGMPIRLVAYALEAPRFSDWLLLGAIWTAVGLWLRRREGWAFPGWTRVLQTVAILAVGIFILFLYDDSHFVDMGAYTTIVGPALHALRGGIPMVDTYSQYGFLTWFVYSAAFTLFEPTFGTAAVLMRLINILYFLVILAMVVAVTRRRVSALWFFVPGLIVAVTTHNAGPTGMWNMNAIPMVLGGRWLLPSTLTLLSIVAPGRNWSRWVAVGLVMLASLSSVDIFAFTVGPWGVSLLADALRRRSLRAFWKWIALTGAGVVVAQAGLVGAVYLLTGRVVDYRPYFDLFAQFSPSMESVWSAQFVPYYALWLPICISYFLIISAALYRALRQQPANSIVERLLPVAVLGLGPLAYFFGRPQEGTLNIACVTFAVVAVSLAEIMFMNAQRFGPVGPVLAGTMVAAFVFIIADGFEHFMRPLDPSRGNSSILRRCFTEEGCRLADVAHNINLALHTEPLDPRTKVGFYAFDDGKRQRIEEATSMLRRLAPDSRYVGMLTDSFPAAYADSDTSIGLTSFMVTGQWFAWPLSSPLNDSLSARIIALVAKSVEKTPTGTLIVISNSFMTGRWIGLATSDVIHRASTTDTNRIADRVVLKGEKLLDAAMYHQRENLLPVNQAILTTLLARCDLRLVERGKYHSAFETEKCVG